MKRLFVFAILAGAIVFLRAPATLHAQRAVTLDDLKKLSIVCFVPSYLPEGFKVKSVQITNDDYNAALPLYEIEWGDEGKATFSIDSAREGIGDRNLMGTDDTDDMEMKVPPLGSVFLIYTPRGRDGIKTEIKSNWVSDANMNAEKAKDPLGHPDLGRYHGFSATGISLKEFEKILQSLHSIRSEPTPTPKPKAKGKPATAPKH
jgi:hypothetical protein